MSETEKNRAEPVALDNVAGGQGQTTSGGTASWQKEATESAGKAGAAGKAGKVSKKVIK